MRPRIPPPPNPIPLLLAAGAVLLTLSGRARAAQCPHVNTDSGAKQLHSKQIIYENGLKVLGQDLMNALPPDNGTRIVSWADGYLPRFCKEVTQWDSLSPYDMQVFNVTYTDCDEPWIFCRHKASPNSQLDLVNRFGRLPVRMRNYVRHLISLPASQAWAQCYPVAGDLIFHGAARTPSDFTLWVHETAHSVDHHNGPDHDVFTASQAWQDAVKADIAVPDDYARSFPVENTAQHFVLALYGKNVKRTDGKGIYATNKNFYKLRNQYYALMERFSEVLVPGGTCSRDIHEGVNLSDEVVCAGDKAVQCMSDLGLGFEERQVMFKEFNRTSFLENLFGRKHVHQKGSNGNGNSNSNKGLFLTLANVPANNSAEAIAMMTYRGRDNWEENWNLNGIANSTFGLWLDERGEGEGEGEGEEERHGDGDVYGLGEGGCTVPVVLPGEV